MLSNLDDDQDNTNNNKPLYEISVKIDSKISIYATLAFVKKFFQRKSAYFQSKLRAWGKSRSKENKSIYLRHFDTFKKVLDIDLTQFKFLSDQGVALVSVFNELHIKHMFCLQHFLVSLKRNKYSYAIKNIITCCSKQELHNCLIFY